MQPRVKWGLRPITRLLRGVLALIGGFRTKFVFVLIIYFAGFASAIYCLAPVSADAAEQSVEVKKEFGYSVLKSDEFAKSFSVGMRKCLDFSKKAAGIIRQKYDDGELDIDDIKDLKI